MSSSSSSPSFQDLGLSPLLLQAVADLGYQEPSPVQAQAVPLVLQGLDVLAAAQTGTGKTAAFLLPLLQELPRVTGKRQGPLALIVTPTRELAQQIVDVCETIARRTGHRTLTVVGGVSYGPQRSGLARGVDVLVATPGRLEDLINSGDARLDQVRVLVLDEADRMLDMGFLPAIKRIVAACPHDRQTLLFSATLDQSAIGEVRDLVHDPAVVEVARKGATAETIQQFVLPVARDAKNALLPQVLLQEGHRRTIVFCRTKHRADAVCRRLVKAGIKALPIHGNRSQSQRERALKAFREGRAEVLVATDVLSRGIDVPDVDYVVNFDVPADPEDYVHRIGRTGRAGEAGWALTFVTEDDKDDLLATEALMGQTVPTFPRTQNLEVGTEVPALDPERVPAQVKGAPTSGKHRKSRAKAAAAKAVRRQRQSAEARPATTSGAAAKPKGTRTRAGRKPAATQAHATPPKQTHAATPKPAKHGDALSEKPTRSSQRSSRPSSQQGAKTSRTAERSDRRSGAATQGDRRQPRQERGSQARPTRRSKDQRRQDTHRGPSHAAESRGRAPQTSSAHPGWQSYNGPRKQRPHNGGRRRPGDKGARG